MKLLAALLCLVACHAAAQYPSKPLRLAVNYPLGGGTDTVVRIEWNGIFAPAGTPPEVVN